MDGSGYLPQEKWHIWSINARSGEAQQLTTGSTHETEPRWSPDGQQILFLSNRSVDPVQEPDADDLYLIPAAGGDRQLVETRYGRKFLPSFSPDGQWIAYLGREQRGKFYQNSCLYIVPSTGGEPRNLSAPFDLHLSSATITDTGSGAAQTPPVWSRDGRHIYCTATERGSQPLLAFATNPGPDDPLRVIDEAGVVDSFSCSADRQKIAYLWSTLDEIGQVRLLDIESSQSKPLSSCNKLLLESLDLGHIEPIYIYSRRRHRASTAGFSNRPLLIRSRPIPPSCKSTAGRRPNTATSSCMSSTSWQQRGTLSTSATRAAARAMAKRSPRRHLQPVGGVDYRRHHGLDGLRGQHNLILTGAYGRHRWQLRRLHDQLIIGRTIALQSGRRPAHGQQLHQLVRLERLNWSHRGAGGRAEATALDRPGEILAPIAHEQHRRRHDADAAHPQRDRLSLRPGTGGAGVCGAQAAGRGRGTDAVPGRVPRLVAQRPHRPPHRPPEHMLRWFETYLK